jgi:hypothetical protein
LLFTLTSLHLQDDSDEDHDQKIRFEGEEHPERHDRLRRRDTPHYLKDKRVNLNGDEEDKVKEILAKATEDGSCNEEVSDNENEGEDF